MTNFTHLCLAAVQTQAEQSDGLKNTLASTERRAADLSAERDSLAAQLADLQQHNSQLLSQVEMITAEKLAAEQRSATKVPTTTWCVV